MRGPQSGRSLRSLPAVGFAALGRSALAALLVLAPALALAEDTQLWLDHAVHDSDRVVEGSYEGGVLAAKRTLKGKAREKMILDKEDLEPHKAGRGVFFLLARFDAKGGEDPDRFIVWQAPQGVAWEGTSGYLGYRPADDSFAITEIAPKEAFEKLLGASLARQRALDAALAVVDSKARAAALAELVTGAHDGSAAVTSALGPDPFAERALAEIGRAGEISVLDALRSRAKLAWIRPAAIRALAAAPGSEPRLEAIALDSSSSEEEVVVAIGMLFSSEDARVETLEKLSFDARAPVRRAVASALREKVKDLKTLERLMKDADPTVRDAARDSARAAARRLSLPLPE